MLNSGEMSFDEGEVTHYTPIKFFLCCLKVSHPITYFKYYLLLLCSVALPAMAGILIHITSGIITWHELIPMGFFLALVCYPLVIISTKGEEKIMQSRGYVRRIRCLMYYQSITHIAAFMVYLTVGIFWFFSQSSVVAGMERRGFSASQANFRYRWIFYKLKFAILSLGFTNIPVVGLWRMARRVKLRPRSEVEMSIGDSMI